MKLIDQLCTGIKSLLKDRTDNKIQRYKGKHRSQTAAPKTNVATVFNGSEAPSIYFEGTGGDMAGYMLRSGKKSSKSRKSSQYIEIQQEIESSPDNQVKN